MTLQKRMPAALLGAALITLALSALGGTSATNFGDPLPWLNAGQRARFLAGKAAFEDDETVPDGLGPVFNGTSCVSCHSAAATGGGSSIIETRFGRIFNGLFDPMTGVGGSLIQNQGIGLFNSVNFVGEVVPREATIVAQRRTTPLFGLGLVDNVPDQTLLNLAQQTGGRPNMVPFADPNTGHASIDPDTGQPSLKVGRFGWKCQQATLFTFSGDAYLNEMGITTPMFPDENCPQGRCDLLQANPAPTNPNDPDNSTLVKLSDFMTFLGAPPPGPVTAQARSGAQTFAAIGCANCHVPALQTGDNVTFFPFSDFLLHDMGSLNDGIAQNGASGQEMRTAPLWGVRVLKRFLHDGRAASLSQAILAHDGQGKAARDNFASLHEIDQNNLIAFLKSL